MYKIHYSLHPPKIFIGILLCHFTFSSRVKKLFPETAKTTFIQSVVISHLDYRVATYVELSEKIAKRLQRIQNITSWFAIKKINVSTSYHKLGRFQLSTHHSFHVLVFLHTLIKIKRPTYLFSNFKFLGDTNSLNFSSREYSNIAVQAHKFCIYTESYPLYAMKPWNKLLEHVRNPASLFM